MEDRAPAIELAVLAAVLACAAFFRLWRLETVPPGLYVDEVLVTERALGWRLTQDGALFAGTRLSTDAGEDVGNEDIANLYFATASVVLRVFGADLFGARMVSVLPSLLAVPLLWALARVVTGPRAALV